MATYTVEYSRASEGLGMGRVREVPLTADAIDILERIKEKEPDMLGMSSYARRGVRRADGRRQWRCGGHHSRGRCQAPR